MAISGDLGIGACAQPAPAARGPLWRYAFRVLALAVGAVAALLLAAAAASAEGSPSPAHGLSDAVTRAVQHETQRGHGVAGGAHHTVREVVRRTASKRAVSPRLRVLRPPAAFEVTRTVLHRLGADAGKVAEAVNPGVVSPRTRVAVPAGHAVARRESFLPQPAVVPTPHVPTARAATTTTDQPPRVGAATGGTPRQPGPWDGPASGSQAPPTSSGSEQHPGSSTPPGQPGPHPAVARVRVPAAAVADPVARAGPVELRPA